MIRPIRLLALTMVAVAACTPQEEPSALSIPVSGLQAEVVYVSDGDSLTVLIDGREESVRLIGINAPEGDECFGEEARSKLRDLVDGSVVTLVPDEEEVDQYGRWLRYVYAADDQFVNLALVQGGYAMARDYYPNSTAKELLAEAEKLARDGSIGLWAQGACASEISTVVIVDIEADAPGPDDENLNGEWIEIENKGGNAVSLSGWGIRDAESINRYSFPDIILAPRTNIRIRTGCGTDDQDNLYWCSPSPVWNNRGDVALLTDSEGRIADRLAY